MPAFSTAQLALTEVLRQRLAAAGCQRGRFDVSEPGATLSLSGEKANGNMLFFWEFGQAFHQLVDAYLTEQYDEHTARLTIQIDMTTAQVQYLRTPKVTADAPPSAPPAAALPLLPDRTPYGPTLAAQVAARLDQGATLAHYQAAYCGMGLAREESGAYQYGEVWNGRLVATQEFATWATFIAWLGAQSDYSLAGLATSALGSRRQQPLTRQRLAEFAHATSR